jgi:hypothetical protein
MDEQPHTPATGGGPEPDEVTAVDLAPSSGDGGAPRSKGAGPWVGRAAIAVLAVALIAGGIVIARQDDDSEGGTTLGPLALALGGRNGEAAADALYPAAGYEYRLEGPLPDLGSEAPVYRLVRPELSADDVAMLAASLGVSATPQLQSDESWLADDGAHSLSLYPAPGAWQLAYGSTGGGTSSSPGVAVEELDDSDPPVTHTVPLGPPETPSNLPDEAGAEQIARDLLGSLGVLDAADWDVTVQAGGIMSSGCAEATTPADKGDETADGTKVDPATGCGPTDETVLSWNVTFARVVDGVATTGLEWAVDVVDGGEIDFAYGALTDLEKVGDYPLRSTDAAFAALQAGETLYGYGMLGDPAAVSSVGVNDVAVDSASGSDGDDSGSATVGASSGSATNAGTSDGSCPPDAPCPTVPPTVDPDTPVSTCVAGDTAYACDDPPAGVPITTIPCDTADGEECAVAPPSPPCDDTGYCGGPECPDNASCFCDELAVPEVGADGTSEDSGPATTTNVVTEEDSGPATEPGTAPACAAPEPLPPECDPTVAECPVNTLPPIEPTVVIVTGAELRATVIPGTDDGADVSYLVPSYRFLGHLESDGIEWNADVLALADSAVTEPTPPTTVESPPSTAPGTVTTTPATTPQCSNETPEACGGSTPTTQPPTTPTTPTTALPTITTTSIVCITDPCEIPEESGGAQD